MPAYDKPIVINTPKVKQTRVGAVIVFRPGTDREKAQRFLDEMVKREIINPTAAMEFDPEWGGPVWYVP